MGVLCYGSLGPDLVHRLDRLPAAGDDLRSRSSHLCYGGSAANPAVALAAWGVPVKVAGHQLGDDPLGSYLVGELRRRGVGTQLLEVGPTASTPHCVVLLTGDGERTIVCSGYEKVEWRPVPEAAWEGTEVLLVGGYSGAVGSRVARQAGRRGVPVACFDGHAQEARLVIWSRREHPDEEEALRLSDGRTVMLTDGPRAVTAFSDGRRLLVQPPAVPARDTTGAGDVFAAMCALGLLRAWEMEWTLLMAATAASLLVATGRTVGIPALQAIEEAASRATNSPESAPTTTHSAYSAAAQPPSHH